MDDIQQQIDGLKQAIAELESRLLKVEQLAAPEVIFTFPLPKVEETHFSSVRHSALDRQGICEST